MTKDQIQGVTVNELIAVNGVIQSKAEFIAMIIKTYEIEASTSNLIAIDDAIELYELVHEIVN